MGLAIQLDFFEPVEKVDLLEKEFRLLDKKCKNVQKGLFARFGTLEEKFELLQDFCYQQTKEIEELKKNIKIKGEVVDFK